MSKDKKDNKKKGETEFRPKTMGPSGFPLFDYLGKGKDHTAAWMRFKTHLKGARLSHKLDKLIDKIIDRGIQPTVEPMNKAKLYVKE